MTRRIRSGSAAGVVWLLSVGTTLAQAPGYGTDSFVLLFRSQSVSNDFVAVSVDGFRTLQELEELVCEIVSDSGINIGASRSLDLQIYRDISPDEYVPAAYLRFLDESAAAVFESQERQTLSTYRWTDVSLSPSFIQSRLDRLAREGIDLPSSIELRTDGNGITLQPRAFHEFDHTDRCTAP